MRVIGVENVIKNLRKAGEKGKDAALRGLEKHSQHVISEAQKIVPFDEGGLQKNIIDEPIRNETKVIGFDGPYAAKQHEDTSLRHPGPKSSNPGRGAQGQPKYLETPVKQESKRMKDFISAEVKKEL